MITRCELCKKIIWFWQRRDIFGKQHYTCDKKNFFKMEGEIPNIELQWLERERSLY